MLNHERGIAGGGIVADEMGLGKVCISLSSLLGRLKLMIL